MKKYIKKIVSVLIIILSILSIQISIYSHSGRTDANGGHRDNKNKSGLGSYHYHCGGHPAHLHPNGVCPYSSSSQSSTSSSESSSSASSGSSSGSSSSSTSESSSSSSSSSTTTTSIPSTIEVTEIQIQEKIEDMEIGENEKLTANITPSNATDKNVTWQSSDESIATVDSTGEVIAKKSGVVTITATTSNGKSSTITINVKEPVKLESSYTTNTLVGKTNTEIENTINTDTNNEEGSALGGIITLGLLGGGGYWGYKRYKTKSK